MSAKTPVILLRKETTPDDIHGMDVAKGILTAVGGKLVARRGCRSRHGPSLCRRRRRHRDQRARKDRDRETEGKKSRSRKATGFPWTAPPAKSITARRRRQDPDPNSPIFAKFMSWPTSSAASSVFAPMPTSRATQRPPAHSAPKASASAAPSTCSSPKIACRTCRR